jgi:hypothetical protein
MKGKHYIEEMPDNIRQQWIEKPTSDLHLIEEHDYENFRQFLYQTLVWAKTRQGHAYWEDIANDDLLCESIEKLATRSQNLEELGI